MYLKVSGFFLIQFLTTTSTLDKKKRSLFIYPEPPKWTEGSNLKKSKTGWNLAYSITKRNYTAKAREPCLFYSFSIPGGEDVNRSIYVLHESISVKWNANYFVRSLSLILQVHFRKWLVTSASCISSCTGNMCINKRKFIRIPSQKKRKKKKEKHKNPPPKKKLIKKDRSDRCNHSLQNLLMLYYCRWASTYLMTMTS